MVKKQVKFIGGCLERSKAGWEGRGRREKSPKRNSKETSNYRGQGNY